jgi:hypothetical protein
MVGLLVKGEVYEKTTEGFQVGGEMKRLVLSGLLLASPAFCDIFGISDAIYWAQQLTMMSQQLNQAREIYANAMQYKQLFDNASAFVHNPAGFLAQTAALSNMALNTANAAGLTTGQRAQRLQQMIRMQQVAMQEAQGIATLSNGNMQGIGMMASALANTSEQLAQTNLQLAHESRVAFYQSRDTYQPQGGLITAWKLK